MDLFYNHPYFVMNFTFDMLVSAVSENAGRRHHLHQVAARLKRASTSNSVHPSPLDEGTIQELER